MSSKITSAIRSKSKTIIQHQLKRSRPFKPVIISDIDGVLVRGNTPIPQTLQAMQRIIDNKIPFACLTNGGGQLELIKTDKLNKAFGKKLFDSAYMFMNHTPLKPQLIRHSKMSGNLLVTGSLNITDILKDLKVTNYILADEIYAIYLSEKNQYSQTNQKQQDQFKFHYRQITKQQAIKNVQDRLGRKLKTFEQQAQQINSIFALNDVSPYETALQVIHNVVKCKQQKQGKAVSYYAAQNDIVWAGGYFKPRLAFGPFNYILDEHCKRHGLKLIQHIYYGKPQEKAFKFVEQQMKKVEPDAVFFMIGDNPRADIAGANRIGWYSFLTRTGIHQGQENDPHDPATIVVQNFSEAVQIIISSKSDLY